MAEQSADNMFRLMLGAGETGSIANPADYFRAMLGDSGGNAVSGFYNQNQPTQLIRNLLMNRFGNAPAAQAGTMTAPPGTTPVAGAAPGTINPAPNWAPGAIPSGYARNTDGTLAPMPGGGMGSGMGGRFGGLRSAMMGGDPSRRLFGGGGGGFGGGGYGRGRMGFGG